MKLNQLREFVKQFVREEQDYQQLFKHMLDKYGKSIADMSDDEKKKFFNAVDTAYKAKSEGRLAGYNESVNESAEILKPGTKVKLRGGKTGKVVRYDGKTPGAPFYIVDIGQYYSIEVPADQIKTESVNELMTYSARSKETGKVVMFKDKEHRDAAIKRGTFTPSENNPKKQSPVSKTKGASVFETESVNEISSIDGLTDVVKGQTSHIEGVKLSKGMADHIISWINTSPYGKKYNSWVKKNSIEKILPIAFNWGLERYLPANLKNEFSALKEKYGKEKKEDLTAGQKKIDVDGDGEIEGSDLAKLRAKNESLPKWNTEREATKMAVGKGRYDDKVIVNRTTKQADIYNDYMNKVAKDDNDRTWASRLIWHSESQGEFNNNFEKLEKLVAKHK